MKLYQLLVIVLTVTIATSTASAYSKKSKFKTITSTGSVVVAAAGGALVGATLASSTSRVISNSPTIPYITPPLSEIICDTQQTVFDARYLQNYCYDERFSTLVNYKNPSDCVNSRLTKHISGVITAEFRWKDDACRIEVYLPPKMYAATLGYSYSHHVFGFHRLIIFGTAL